MTFTIFDPLFCYKFENERLIDINGGYAYDLLTGAVEREKREANEILEGSETTGNEQPALTFTRMYIIEVDIFHIDQDLYMTKIKDYSQ